MATPTDEPVRKPVPATRGKPRVSRSVAEKIDPVDVVSLTYGPVFCLLGTAAAPAYTAALKAIDSTSGRSARSPTSALWMSPTSASIDACSDRTTSPWSTRCWRIRARKPGLSVMMTLCVCAPLRIACSSAWSTFGACFVRAVCAPAFETGPVSTNALNVMRTSGVRITRTEEQSSRHGSAAHDAGS
jgi:hypothetical protein